jgi:hypothetical protein
MTWTSRLYLRREYCLKIGYINHPLSIYRDIQIQRAGSELIFCQSVLSVAALIIVKIVFAIQMKDKNSAICVATVVFVSAISHIKNVRQIATAKYAPYG